MGMFDKLVRKGKTMAMQYAKEQLSRRSGQQHPSGGTQGYGQSQGYGQPGYGQDQGYGGRQYPSAPNQSGGRPPQGQGQDADQAAIAKYKYMLHTAPPQDMERAHAEAFSRLTPQQRAMLRDELNSQLPASEHANSDRPEVLARTATRAEVSRPGFMERILGRGGQGGRLAAGAAGAAGGLGAGLLAGVAAGFVGSAIAGPLLEGFSGIGEGIAGAAEGVGDGIASAGEGFGDQGGFGGFFGDTDGGFGDFEL